MRRTQPDSTARLLTVFGTAILALAAACSSAAPASPAPTAAKPTPSATSAALVPPAPSSAAPTAGVPASGAPAPSAQTLAALSPPVEAKIGVQSTISDGALYIAAARGYFQELGITPSIEVFSAGAADYVQFIATNQLQAGGPSVVPALFNAAERGATLMVVADKGKLAPGFGYLRFSARKELYDSGQVRALADLRGRTVAIASPYGAAHALASLSLRKVGIADSDVNIVPVPNPDHVAALANGAADAAVSIEPIATRAVQQGVAAILAEGDDLRPNSQAGMLAFSSQFFQNREAALRFLVAYLRGARTYNDAFVKGINKPEIINILIENTTLKDPAVYDQSKLAGLDPDGTLNLVSMREDFDWMKSIDQLPQAMRFPEQMFDQALVQEAARILGPYH